MKYFVGKHEIHLGRKVGDGGEGDVFRIVGHKSYAAKIFKHPERINLKKIKASCLMSQQCSDTIVWPTHIITSDQAGNFCGVILPFISNSYELSLIHSLPWRIENEYQVSFLDMVDFAVQAAASVAELHQKHICLIDIKDRNFLVSLDKKVFVIDTDNFQFGNFSARVRSPDWSAPELQNISLGDTRLSPNIDTFALNILIFMLLHQGLHPYDGAHKKERLNRQEKINRHLWPYDYPYQFHFNDMSKTFGKRLAGADLWKHFKKCFTASPQDRPTTKETFYVLRHYKNNLVQCSLNPLHYFLSEFTRCIWCTIRRELAEFFPRFITNEISIINKNIGQSFRHRQHPTSMTSKLTPTSASQIITATDIPKFIQKRKQRRY